MNGIVVLQSASGSIYMLTITIVGLRLLSLAYRNKAWPELFMGGSLLLGGTLGASLEAVGVAGAHEFSPEVGGALLMTGKAFGIAALTLSCLFVWRVFRADDEWAPWLVAILVGGAALAFVGFARHGSLATGDVPLGWFSLEFAVRVASPVWLVSEAVRYHGMMRKREQLGLANPVVTNRFLLWGLGAGSSVVMLFTSLPPVLLPPDAISLLVLDQVVFTIFGVGASAFYALAFFPPARYVRWLESGHSPTGPQTSH